MRRLFAVPIAVAAALAVGCRNSSTLPGSPTAPASTLPTAPLNIAGVVRDTIMRPIRDARVEVLEGATAGRFAITDEEGRFKLSDSALVTQSVALHFSKTGYSPITGRWPNNVDAVATLVADELLSLDGRYSVTFEAASTCNQLPPAVRTRTFAATIQRATSNRWVFATTLAGATFHPGYDTFWGTESSDAARFYVSSWDAFNWWLEDQPIIERLDSNTYVSLMGIATALSVRSPASIGAAFDGSIAYCAAATEPLQPRFPLACGTMLIDCRSQQHRLTLARR